MDEGSEIGSNRVSSKKDNQPPQKKPPNQKLTRILLLEGSRFRTLAIPNASEDVESQELVFIAGGNAK